MWRRIYISSSQLPAKYRRDGATSHSFDKASIVDGSVQLPRCLTLCNPMDCSPPGFLVFPCPYWSLLKLMSIESVMLSNHLILCSPLLLLPSIFPQGLFQWVGSSHQVAKVLELQLQHQFFQRIFRVDFLWDGLVWSPCSPRTLESSLAPQFESINSLALSLLYGPALTSIRLLGKAIALTRWTSVNKAVSLLFNTLSRFAIAFPPRT